MNIHTNTLILENCVLLVFKRCFNLSFEKQLSSSAFLLLSGCWNRCSSFCVHKVQADVADVHRVNKTTWSNTGPMCTGGSAQQSVKGCACILA